MAAFIAEERLIHLNLLPLDHVSFGAIGSCIFCDIFFVLTSVSMSLSLLGKL